MVFSEKKITKSYICLIDINEKQIFLIYTLTGIYIHL